MGDFNRNYGSGGRRGGGRFDGGRDSGKREMHRATCGECGKDCEVPFRPSGDRPVYCSNCFEKRRNEDGRRPNFEERRSFSPDRGRNAQGRDSGQLMDQLKSLHVKLDKILRILEPKAETSIVPKKEITAIVFEPKAPKAKAPKKKAKGEKVGEV
ncbi:hypothetical protein HZB96_03570 [Candidatus Gottesmanbacteria bacterium]|nr:hypothetical protein [Candidatus Gottesmanbacteria bacterium]